MPTIELDESGYLQFTSERSAPELTRLYVDDQTNLLTDFAEEHEIFYLDLTSAYQQEAGKGVELYYPFDTHSNQKGHDLAATMIVKYIRLH